MKEQDAASKGFDRTLHVIRWEITSIINRRNYYWKEIRSKMPYKCKTQKQAAKKRAEYKKLIKSINEALIEYRKAIKKLIK